MDQLVVVVADTFRTYKFEWPGPRITFNTSAEDNCRKVANVIGVEVRNEYSIQIRKIAPCLRQLARRTGTTIEHHPLIAYNQEITGCPPIRHRNCRTRSQDYKLNLHEKSS